MDLKQWQDIYAWLMKFFLTNRLTKWLASKSPYYDRLINRTWVRFYETRTKLLLEDNKLLETYLLQRAAYERVIIARQEAREEYAKEFVLKRLRRVKGFRFVSRLGKRLVGPLISLHEWIVTRPRIAPWHNKIVAFYERHVRWDLPGSITVGRIDIKWDRFDHLDVYGVFNTISYMIEMYRSTHWFRSFFKKEVKPVSWLYWRFETITYALFLEISRKVSIWSKRIP